jgi:hypothetical protein
VEAVGTVFTYNIRHPAGGSIDLIYNMCDGSYLCYFYLFCCDDEQRRGTERREGASADPDPDTTVSVSTAVHPGSVNATPLCYLVPLSVLERAGGQTDRQTDRQSTKYYYCPILFIC